MRWVKLSLVILFLNTFQVFAQTTKINLLGDQMDLYRSLTTTTNVKPIVNSFGLFGTTPVQTNPLDKVRLVTTDFSTSYDNLSQRNLNFNLNKSPVVKVEQDPIPESIKKEEVTTTSNGNLEIKEIDEKVVENNDQKTQEECLAEINQAVLSLLEDDKKNILGKQYNLTVMKMAKEVLASNKKTLEDYAKIQGSFSDKYNTLKADLSNPESEKKVKELENLYRKYKGYDDAMAVDELATNLTELDEKKSSLAYGNMKTRMYSQTILVNRV